jgi:hypothetical protein
MPATSSRAVTRSGASTEVAQVGASSACSAAARTVASTACTLAVSTARLPVVSTSSSRKNSTIEGRQPGQRELARPHHALAVDPRQQALRAQPLDGGRRAPAYVGVGLDRLGRGRERLLELSLGECAQPGRGRPCVQGHQEAEIERR